MGRIIQNVQLTESERTCVYLSTITGRILGFGHECMTPQFKEGWQRKVLYHARDIEKWSEAYRRQNEEDKQSNDFRKTEQEAPARRAIRAAMVDRRNHVDGHNRAYLDVNILLMDQREERARKVKETGYLLSEAYEGTPRPEDLALQSPAFKGKLPIDGINQDASDIREAMRKTMQGR